jgi:formate dehydrogenase maturation protein FdhE
MFLSKKIWRELLSAMFSSMKSDRKFAKGLASIDYGFIEKLKAMLCDFRARRLLPEGFDTDVAAMVVYGIIMTQAMLYIYEGETTVEQMKREIRRQIAFVFDGKSSGKEGTV